MLNWQQKFDARAKLRVVIEEALDIGLPRAYTPELYQQKCEAVFAHIEQAYPNATATSTRPLADRRASDPWQPQGCCRP